MAPQPPPPNTLELPVTSAQKLNAASAPSANGAAAARSSICPIPPPAPAPPPPPKASHPTEPAAEESEGSLLGDVLYQSPSWLTSMIVHLALLIILALITTVQSIKDGPGEIIASTSDGDPSAQLEELETADLLIGSDSTLLAEVPAAIDLKALAAPSLLPVATSLSATPNLAATPGGGELIGAIGPGASLINRMNSALRGKLVRQEGGTPESEKAVERALAWLAEHQKSDGSWSFDHRQCPKCKKRCGDPGQYANAKNAATAMALLPFLGRGLTHKEEGPYKKTIESGLYFLVRSMKYQGGVGSLHDATGQMYGHGLGAIVLCEAYGMTRDRILERPSQGAINFIVESQDQEGGGWRYVPHQAGDTSVVGWQLMALKSGHMAYLQVPQDTVRRANYFLDSVQGDEGATYGYMGPASADMGVRATTAIGLLCRMYLGWQKEHPAMIRGVEILSELGPAIAQGKRGRTDMYYNYYATQVLRHYGGPQWTHWNEVMREYLIETQSGKGHEEGSWFFERGDMGTSAGGRLYCTALSAMVLEVYYRHMPLYAEQSVKDNFFVK